MLIKLPENEKNFSNILREIKKKATKKIRKQVGKPDLLVWQDRFWEHTIRDDRDLQIHYDYILYNPVKHGYVGDIGDWHWVHGDGEYSGKSNGQEVPDFAAMIRKGHSFGE